MITIALKPSRIGMDDLSNYIGISKPEIYEKMNPQKEGYDKDFPTPVKYGKKNLFILEEIDDWLKKDNEKLRKKLI